MYNTASSFVKVRQNLHHCFFIWGFPVRPHLRFLRLKFRRFLFSYMCWRMCIWNQNLVHVLSLVTYNPIQFNFILLETLKKKKKNRSRKNRRRNLEQNKTQCRWSTAVIAWEGERGEEKGWDGGRVRWRGGREKTDRGKGEKADRETLSRSCRFQAGPWRGFWIQQQYQASGAWG